MRGRIPAPSATIDYAAQLRPGILEITGVTVFTIGLGSDLEHDALRAMASSPGAFFEAPDAEDLAAIYEQIAVEIPCPPSRWWGRR